MNNMSEEALYFDQDVAAYEVGRPGYPTELYNMIRSHVPRGGRYLEAGAGNGLASDTLLEVLTPNELVMVEPGHNFCKLLRKKYSDKKQVKIVEERFENYHSDQKFDAIFSATAWHWLDTPTKYRKAYQMVKQEGYLVVFWNNFHRTDGRLKDDMDRVYKKYDPSYRRQIDRFKKIVERKKEFEENGFFDIAEQRIFEGELELKPEQYLNLIKTYPDHGKFGPEYMRDMERVLAITDECVKMQLLTNCIIGIKRESY